MYQGKYVYSQLTDFLPKRVFDILVDKYNGNKHVRFFSCWNQLACMLFGQLTGRESMRDLIIGLDVHKKSWSVTIVVDGIEHRTFTQPPDPNALFNYLQRMFPGGISCPC